MRVRAYARADGGVTVVYPIRAMLPEETAATFRDDVFGRAEANDVAIAGRPFVDLDDAELPGRERRDRWRLVDGAVVAAEEGG